MLQNGPQSGRFDHLGSNGPKWFKMASKVVDFDHLGGLGPKCFKIVPKVIDFDNWGGLSPKWYKIAPDFFDEIWLFTSIGSIFGGQNGSSSHLDVQKASCTFKHYLVLGRTEGSLYVQALKSNGRARGFLHVRTKKPTQTKNDVKNLHGLAQTNNINTFGIVLCTVISNAGHPDTQI